MSKAANAWNARYAKVVARAWADEKFKRKLLKEPAAALADMGIRVPRDVKVKVVENTPATVHLVLPGVPFESDLSDSELEILASLETPTGFCCTHDCLVAPDMDPDET
jgi:hypothetical protein